MTSYSSACCTLRNEFRFLISTLVPSVVAPRGRSETLASQRSEPSSMLPSHTPMKSSTARKALRYAAASSGERRSGWLTVSISGMPERL